MRVEIIIVPVMIALCGSYLLVQIVDIIQLFFFQEEEKAKRNEIKILKKDRMKKSTKKMIWEESNKDDTESDGSINKSNNIKVL